MCTNAPVYSSLKYITKYIGCDQVGPKTPVGPKFSSNGHFVKKFSSLGSQIWQWSIHKPLGLALLATHLYQNES